MGTIIGMSKQPGQHCSTVLVLKTNISQFQTLSLPHTNTLRTACFRLWFLACSARVGFVLSSLSRSAASGGLLPRFLGAFLATFWHVFGGCFVWRCRRWPRSWPWLQHRVCLWWWCLWCGPLKRRRRPTGIHRPGARWWPWPRPRHRGGGRRRFAHCFWVWRRRGCLGRFRGCFGPAR